MFKRYFFTASAAALIASSPALAGSPAPAPVDPVIAPVASAPAFSWAGGYAGVNVGYGGDKAKHPFSIIDNLDEYTANGSLDMTSSGFAGGAQVGWNFQNDGFVYGVEADYQASGIKGETSFNLAAPGGSASGEIGTKLKHFGTIRARVGHTVTDRFLVYGTAGFASGKTESYIRGSISGLGSVDESVSKTKSGWTAGIGAEYAFNDNWSLKSEYMYTDLGKANLYSGDLGIDSDVNANLDRKFNFHMVRVGLNFHF